MMTMMKKTKQDDAIESAQKASLVNIFTYPLNPLTCPNQSGIISPILISEKLLKFKIFFHHLLNLKVQPYRKVARIIQ